MVSMVYKVSKSLITVGTTSFNMKPKSLSKWFQLVSVVSALTHHLWMNCIYNGGPLF